MFDAGQVWSFVQAQRETGKWKMSLISCVQSCLINPSKNINVKMTVCSFRESLCTSWFRNFKRWGSDRGFSAKLWFFSPRKEDHLRNWGHWTWDWVLRQSGGQQWFKLYPGDYRLQVTAAHTANSWLRRYIYQTYQVCQWYNSGRTHQPAGLRWGNSRSGSNFTTWLLMWTTWSRWWQISEDGATVERVRGVHLEDDPLSTANTSTIVKKTSTVSPSWGWRRRVSLTTFSRGTTEIILTSSLSCWCGSFKAA